MDNKDRFTFVNEENNNDEPFKETKNLSDEETLKKEKKRKKRNLIITIIVLIIGDILLLGLGFLWQGFVRIKENPLKATCDSFTLAFAISFIAATVMFSYNFNALSFIIHGTRTFGLMLIGRRPKQSYYEYMKKVQDNPIPKLLYLPVFINSGVLLTVMLGLLIPFL